jgi:WD40 repeat protein/serine/threonine protein kinase
MACPTEETLAAWVGLNPSLEEAAARDHHLDRCDVCRQIVANLAALKGKPQRTDDVFGPPSRTNPAPGVGRGVDTNPGDPVTAAVDRVADYSLAIPDQIDHFQILRPLGKGGMGQVFLARDMRLGRRVAIKVINPKLIGSDAMRELFLREARTTAQFNHPHIVTVYHVGLVAGVPYLALEYLDGETLLARMKRDPPDIRESAHIAHAIALALVEAHLHRVLHRDLKPENVFLARDGRLRVLDFGLAIQGQGTMSLAPMGSAVGSDARPATRRPGGTPSYMAPEQWLNQQPTRATDIWALGVIHYQMIYGRHPFGNSSAAELKQRVVSTDPIAPLESMAGVPQGLLELIGQCLAKAPTERPTAENVASKLQQFLDESTTPDASAEHHPFRGLFPFAQEHRAYYFGRDPIIDAGVERLQHEGALTLVGPSGSGKSSLIQAGLIPRLRDQGYEAVLAIRPGAQPMRALSRALWRLWDEHGLAPDGDRASRNDEVGGLDPARMSEQPHALRLSLLRFCERARKRVVIVVDQFEELISAAEDADEAKSFLRAICALSGDIQDPLRVILALQDGFLGRLGESIELRQACSQVIVLPMPAADELLQTIRGPLRKSGYVFDDPCLAQEMVDSVTGEWGALAMLQHCCRQLWDRRAAEERLLTRRAYEELGGVVGAWVSYADGVVGTLSGAEHRLARTLLLRLAANDRTRRTLALTELLDGLPDTARVMVARLTDARLLVQLRATDPERADVEIGLIHPRLLPRWNTLRQWIDESRDELRALAEVRPAADLWARRGRRAEETWRGKTLAQARQVLDRCVQPVPEVIRSFVELGTRHEARLLRHRRLAIVTLFALVAAVALTATLAALRFAQQKKLIMAKEETARAGWAAAQENGAWAAIERGDHLEAAGRLRTALTLADSALSRMLWWRLQRSPQVWRRQLGSAVYAVAISPNGDSVAVGAQDKAIYVIDRHTAAVRILRGHPDQVISLRYCQGDRYLVAGTWSGHLAIWVRDALRPRLVQAHQGPITALDCASRARRLVTAGFDGRLQLWNTDTWSALRSVAGRGSVTAAAFLGRSDNLAYSTEQGIVGIWNTAEAEPAAPHTHRTAPNRSLASTPDGRHLAVGDATGTIRVIEIVSGREKSHLAGHDGTVYALRFGASGSQLYSGSHDGTVRIWNVATGQATRVLRGHAGPVRGIDLGQTGRFLASASYDKTARLWDLTKRAWPSGPSGHGKPVYALQFDPSGREIASGSDDGSIRLWDSTTGDERSVLRGHAGGVSDLAFRPDGKMLASVGHDKTVRLWTMGGPMRSRVLLGHTAALHALAYSPEGKLLASSGRDKTIRLWEANTGRPRAVLLGSSGAVRSLLFLSEGELLSATADGRIDLWDLKKHARVGTLDDHKAPVWALAFSWATRRIASGGDNRSVRITTMGDSGRSQSIRFPGRVYGIGFTPDGGSIAVAGSDPMVRLMSLDGTTHALLTGHRGEVNRVRVSHSGLIIATGGDDASVRVWSAKSGQPVWRTILMTLDPPSILTHRGLLALDRRAAPRPVTRPGAFWRKLIAVAPLTADVSGPTGCVQLADGVVEIWDLSLDRPLAAARFAPALRLLATPSGCAILVGTKLEFLIRSGARSTFADRVSAVSRIAGKQGILAATLSGLALVGTDDGRRTEAFVVSGTAQAITRAGGQVIAGFEHGTVAAFRESPQASQPELIFQDTPSAAVTRLIPGPAATVVAGFGDGSYGVWSARDGMRLLVDRLPGGISHLLARGGLLYVASELGHVRVVDLRVLVEEYCALLRRTWRSIPVVYRDGRIALARLDSSHRCSGTTSAGK